ncbi:MAG: hypothetical protein WEA58_11275 [Balneolaceae bacterium]
MNITIDLLIPPIIIALLIGMIFSTNALVMESTVENRLSYELQSTANTVLTVIEQEVRGIKEIVNLETDQLQFIDAASDTVTIFRDEMSMMVETSSAPGSPEQYNARLYELNFDLAGVTGSPPILRVSIITESRAEQEVGTRPNRYRAVSERDIYLRNLHIAQL